jgi:hypothetical protein
MKKIIILVVFTLSLIANSYAQNGSSIVGGINFSTFYDEEDNGWSPGISFGIRKNIYLINNFDLNVEIFYSITGGNLKNKAIGPYGDYSERIYFHDIKARVGYIEIPLSIEYRIHKINNSEISLLLGYFLAIPLFDLSLINKNKYLFTFDFNNPEHKNYIFEYYPNDQSGFGIGNNDYEQNHGLILGLKTNIHNYFIELRYRRDLESIGYIATISRVNKKPHSMSILIAMHL